MTPAMQTVALIFKQRHRQNVTKQMTSKERCRADAWPTHSQALMSCPSNGSSTLLSVSCQKGHTSFPLRTL